MEEDAPLSTLARLGKDPQSCVYLEPSASEEAIRRMQEDARRDLGAQVPDGYLALLRVTNGVPCFILSVRGRWRHE